MAQVNRLTGSTDEFIKLIRRIEGRVSTLETRGTGPIFVSDQIVTQDPLTGVETIFGALPDGRHGMQEWVNDTEPPPKPSAPVVSGSRALYELVWDGLDSSGLPQPYDYDRTVVQMASEASSLIWVEVGSLSAAGRLIIANQEPGQKKLFRLVSYDKNKNMSTPSDSVASTLTSFTQTPEMIAYMKEMQEWVDTANGRIDQAKVDVETTTKRLGETEIKLDATAEDISGLAGTIGDINRSVSEAEQKAASAEAAARQATTTAGSAAQQYDELRIKLDSALAAKPGLINDSGFELSDQWSGAYGASIIASSAARSGSKVVVLPYDNTNTSTDKAVHLYSLQDIQVVEDHQYRLTVYVYSTGEVSPNAEINFITRRGTTGNQVFLNATERVKLVDLGVTEGNWRVFQTTWTAPESYDVNFGVYARSLSSNIYLDDFQIVDSTQEASLQIAVEDAKQKAEAAARDALAAMTAANLAKTAADGKTTITDGTNAPSGVGLDVGDIHRQYSSMGSGGQLLREWRWNGDVWVERQISGDILSELDVGKLSGTFANISQHLKAGSISTDKLLVGIGQNMIPWSMVLAGDVGPHIATGDPSNKVEIQKGDADRATHLWFTNTTAETGFIYLGQLCSGGQHPNDDGRSFPVTPGRTVRFSTRVQMGGTYSGGVPSVRIPIRFNRGDGSFISIPAGPAQELTWSPDSYVHEVVVPDGAASASVLVQINRPGGVRIIDPDFREMTDGSLIVNGTITGKHVNATSVAAEIGQFVKVQAQNVEVSGDLAARLVSAMRTETKDLIVTESAVMKHITAIEGVITPKITVLSGDIINAQNAATQAQRAADDAAAEAREAVGLAGTKGEIIYQATAPTGAQANATNLWIRSSDNKPHTWSGTNWVARTDKAATEAAAAASRANTAATAARAKIDSVTTTELGATVIDGGKILTDSITAKSIHVDTELSANVARFMDASARNLIVTGSATLPADTYIKGLTADAVKAIKIEVSQLTAANSNFDTAVVNRLWAQKIQSQKIFASEVIIGTGANLIANGFGELGDNTNFSDFSINSTSALASPVGCQHTYWTTSTGGRRLDSQWKVTPGRTYFWEINTMGQNAGQRCYVQIQWFDAAGSLISSPYVISNQDPTQSWKLWSGQITAPANAVSAGMILYGNHSNGTQSSGQWQRWGGLVFQEAAGGNLIVNGSITTRHINAETFDVTQLLRANSIEAKYLKVDEIKDAVRVDSDIFNGRLYTGATFQGSEFRTHSSRDRGIAIFPEGMRVTNVNSGRRTFDINATTGEVQITGTFTTGVQGEPSIRVVSAETSWNGVDQGVWFTYDGNPYGWVRSDGNFPVAGVFTTAQPGSWNMTPNVPLQLRGFGQGGIKVWDALNIENRMDSGSSVIRGSGALTIMSGGNVSFNSRGRFYGGRSLSTGGFFVSSGDGYGWETGAAANVRMTTNGMLWMVTSKRANKLDIKPYEVDESILSLPVRDWIDRVPYEEFQRLQDNPERPLCEQDQAYYNELENVARTRSIGVVAEEALETGARDLVEYDNEGEVVGFAYSKLAVLHQPFIKELWEFKKKYQPMVEELEELLPKLRELTA